MQALQFMDFPEILRHLESIDPDHIKWKDLARLAELKMNEADQVEADLIGSLNRIRTHPDFPYFRGDFRLRVEDELDSHALSWQGRKNLLSQLEGLYADLGSLSEARRCSVDELDFAADTLRMKRVAHLRQAIIERDVAIHALWLAPAESDSEKADAVRDDPPASESQASQCRAMDSARNCDEPSAAISGTPMLPSESLEPGHPATECIAEAAPVYEISVVPDDTVVESAVDRRSDQDVQPATDSGTSETSSHRVVESAEAKLSEDAASTAAEGEATPASEPPELVAHHVEASDGAQPKAILDAHVNPEPESGNSEVLSATDVPAEEVGPTDVASAEIPQAGEQTPASEPDPPRATLRDRRDRLFADFSLTLAPPSVDEPYTSPVSLGSSISDLIDRGDWISAFMLSLSAENLNVEISIDAKFVELVAALELGIWPDTPIGRTIDWRVDEQSFTKSVDAAADLSERLLRLAVTLPLWLAGGNPDRPPDSFYQKLVAVNEISEVQLFANAMERFVQRFGSPGQLPLHDIALRRKAVRSDSAASRNFEDWKDGWAASLRAKEKAPMVDNNEGSREAVLELLEGPWNRAYAALRDEAGGVSTARELIRDWRDRAFFQQTFLPIIERETKGRHTYLAFPVWNYFHDGFKEGCQFLEQAANARESLLAVGRSDLDYFIGQIHELDTLGANAQKALDAQNALERRVLSSVIRRCRAWMSHEPEPLGPHWLTDNAKSWRAVLGRRLAGYPNICLTAEGECDFEVPQFGRIADAILSPAGGVAAALKDRLMRGDVGWPEEVLGQLDDTAVRGKVGDLRRKTIARITDGLEEMTEALSQRFSALDKLGCVTLEDRASLEFVLELNRLRSVGEWRSAADDLVGEERRITERLTERFGYLRERWDAMRMELWKRTAVTGPTGRDIEAVIDENLKKERFLHTERMLDQLAVLLYDSRIDQPPIDINRQLQSLLNSDLSETMRWLGDFISIYNTLESTLANSSLEVMYDDIKEEAIGPRSEWDIAPASLPEFLSACQGWGKLLTWAENAPGGMPSEPIMAVLNYLGFSATEQGQDTVVPSSTDANDRLFYIAATAGEASPIPQFGSQRKSGWKVWIATPQKTITDLLARVPQTGTWPNLILYLGRLSWAERKQLAHACKEAGEATLFIDEIVMLYLARFIGNRAKPLFWITIPFSGANPYLHEEGKAPDREMFVGRGHQVNELLKNPGYYFLYGGRQMGKSTLLEYLRIRAEQLPEEYFFVSEVLRKSSFEKIWSNIDGKLRNKKIVLDRTAANKPSTITTRIQSAYASGEERRRLLILLDEVEQALETEVSSGSLNLSALEELVNSGSTKNFVSVVLAGNYHAQRYFTSNAAEERFRPIRVGALDFAEAVQLIRTPLHALGFCFAKEGPGLELGIQRILDYTIFHAGITQLFLYHLVAWLYRKQTTPVPSSTVPPGFDVPFELTPEIIDRFAADDDVRIFPQMVARFEKTLEPDLGYQLIFFSLALCQPDTGDLETWFALKDIKDQLRLNWKDGFALLERSQQTDRWIRARIIEMAGLGLLISDSNHRYRVRGGRSLIQLFGGRESMIQKLSGLRHWLPGDNREAEERHDPASSEFPFVSLFRASSVIEHRADVSRLRVALTCTLNCGDHLPDGFHRALAPNPHTSATAIDGASVGQVASELEAHLRSTMLNEEFIYYIRVTGENGCDLPSLATAIKKVFRNYGAKRKVQALLLLDVVAAWNWYRTVPSPKTSEVVIRIPRMTQTGVGLLFAAGKERGVRGEGAWECTSGWYQAVEDLREIQKSQEYPVNRAVEIFRNSFQPGRYWAALGIALHPLGCLLKELCVHNVCQLESAQKLGATCQLTREEAAAAVNVFADYEFLDIVDDIISPEGFIRRLGVAASVQNT